MSLLFSRFGLSNKFDTEFPSVLTGKVSVRLNCSFKWKDAVHPVVSVLRIHAHESTGQRCAVEFTLSSMSYLVDGQSLQCTWKQEKMICGDCCRY